MTLLVLAAACRYASPEEATSPDLDPGLDTGETPEDDGLTSLLDGRCEPSSDASPSPLTRTGWLQINEGDELDEFVMDILEVEADFERQVAWAAGQGGVVTFDISGSDPVYRTRWWAEDDSGLAEDRIERFHHIEILNRQTLLATHRNEGFFVAQWPEDDPLGPMHEVARVEGADYNGVTASDGEAWFTRLDGTIERWNLDDPSDPRLVETLDGFGHPWEVWIDAHKLYVGDNDLGLVIVDHANDSSLPMEIVGTIETGGSPQDVEVESGIAYVANGAAGIWIGDVSDPRSPVELARFDVGSSVVSVSYSERLLWAIAHEQVMVFDVADPAHPVPLGAYPTPEWGLSVDAEGSRAVVGDWGNLEVFEVDPTVHSPELYLSPGEVQFWEGAGSVAVTIQNQGSADLRLEGGSVDDPRIDVVGDRTVVSPGESITVEVQFTDDGADLDTSWCLITNDGDESPLEIPIGRGVRGNGEMVVGQTAWDFALQDLDGNWHSLSDAVNNTVFLIFFATW